MEAEICVIQSSSVTPWVHDIDQGAYPHFTSVLNV